MTSGLSSKVWLLQNRSQQQSCSDPEATFTLKLPREQRESRVPAGEPDGTNDFQCD